MNRRILVIDDKISIQEDFRKILCSDDEENESMDLMERELFGSEGAKKTSRVQFELDSALQGQEGLEMVKKALEEGRPYAMAFIDIRMPPGWDGVETTEHVWEIDPNLQIVLCTAYSDYSWDKITDRFGHLEQLLILKKPFDNIEVLQLATSLTAKWELLRQTRNTVQDLESQLDTARRRLESQAGE